MSTPADIEPGRLRMERVLPAAIDEVFAAWTDAAQLSRWLSPTRSADVEADVRVGGRLLVRMHGGDMSIEHVGEYRVVDPPRRLSFTWQSPYTGDVPSLVTVELTAEAPSSTRLVLVHEQLPQDAAESHAGGWSSILDNLALVLAEGRRAHY